MKKLGKDWTKPRTIKLNNQAQTKGNLMLIAQHNLEVGSILLRNVYMEEKYYLGSLFEFLSSATLNVVWKT